MLKHITSKVLIYPIVFFIAAVVTPAKVAAQQTQAYPKVTGFFAIVNPIGSFSNGGFHSNLSGAYTVGFPFGVNILKSESFGVSFEFVPYVRTENHVAKVNSVLFHPGAVFRFKHGFNLIGRLAFESSGRFGVTPVVNQIIKKGKDASLFMSVPFPVRFGNGLPTSVGAAIQVGVSF
ncbi:hypothetical protein [Mucilaginibacter sp. HD30]